MKTLKVILYLFIGFAILGFIGIILKKESLNKANANTSESHQCNVQINRRPDGATIRYTRPEPIATNERLEYGVSLQTNGNAYYLASVIRFKRTAQEPVGSLTIQYSENTSSSLNYSLVN